MQIRELTPEDADASLRASRDAFGGPLADRTAFTLGNGVRRWGIFDGAILSAKAVDREYWSMIGGRPVSTSGVAGVVVTPEYRGTGLARQVMTHVLGQARERGAVISTLFRTTPALYRSLGYEQVAELQMAELPSSALRGLRMRSTVRRATVADAASIKAVYAQIASTGSCLLTRTGPCFTATDQEMIDSFDGITVAVNGAGEVSGYLTWSRGEGWGPTGVLTVTELHAMDAAATESLLAVAGSFDTVTSTVRFRTSGADPIHWIIPGAGWSVTDVRPYMLRVVDLAGAVAQRGWPPALTAAINITVRDPLCPWNSGDHRLVWDAGSANLESGSADHQLGGQGRTDIDPRGLAVMVAGGVTTATMRRAGLISGGNSTDDRVLDAAMAGPRPAILDFF